MILLLVKSLLKYKKGLLKINIINIILGIFPIVVLINEYNSTYDINILTKISLYGLFVSVIFEMIFFTMNFLQYNKIYDVLISKTGLLVFAIKYSISLFIVFLPSFFMQYALYSVLFLAIPDLIMLFYVLLMLFIVIIMYSILSFAIFLRKPNIFHQINLTMDIVKILSGTTYPIVVMPAILIYFSKANMFSYISKFVDSGKFHYEFFIVAFVMIVITMFLVRGVKKK